MVLERRVTPLPPLAAALRLSAAVALTRRPQGHSPWGARRGCLVALDGFWSQLERPGAQRRTSIRSLRSDATTHDLDQVEGSDRRSCCHLTRGMRGLTCIKCAALVSRRHSQSVMTEVPESKIRRCKPITPWRAFVLKAVSRDRDDLALVPKSRRSSWMSTHRSTAL